MMTPEEASNLASTRAVLAYQQQWNEVIGVAYQQRWAAGMFACWLDARDWLDEVRPVTAPSPAARAVWVACRQREVEDFRARSRPGLIPPERQLEIALASLARSRPVFNPDDSWAAAPVEMVSRLSSSRVTVRSGRRPGERCPPGSSERILLLTRQGKSTVEIAIAVGVSERQVARVRTAARKSELEDRREGWSA